MYFTGNRLENGVLTFSIVETKNKSNSFVERDLFIFLVWNFHHSTMGILASFGKTLVSFIILLSISGAHNILLGQEKLQVKNTQVWMSPPEGFVEAEGFIGFLHRNSGVAIQVTEIDSIPFTYVTGGLTESYFKDQGVRLITQEKFKTNEGKHAEMFVVAFQMKEIEFHRIMFFTGDLNQSIWINVTYQEKIEKLIMGDIKESLKTVQF